MTTLRVNVRGYVDVTVPDYRANGRKYGIKAQAAMALTEASLPSYVGKLIVPTSDCVEIAEP